MYPMNPYASPLGQQQPNFQQNPIMGQLPQPGQLPSYGGQQQMQPLMGGQQQMSPPTNGGQQHHGMNPAFMMGILPGLMAGGHLGSLAPLFGIGGMAAKHFGLFK